MQVPELVRRFTNPLFGGVRLPVLSGVNRGRWWSLISYGSGYGTGLRAGPQMELLASLLRPGDVMWDVGAHQGYVTLCAAREVGPAGSVHAFEPSARNRGILERHLRWNRVDNASVHGCALSDHDGTAHFGGNGTSKTFALGAGHEMVEVRQGRSLVSQGVCATPTFLKVDVEGAEADVIAGLLPVLPRSARLIVAVHSPQADERCSALLRDAGFTLVPSRALETCRRGTWYSDPDLYCYGPEARVSAGDADAMRAAGF